MNFRPHLPRRRRREWRRVVVAVCVAGQLLGCRTPQPVHYLGDADLQHYKTAATQIDYPQVDSQTEPAALFADRPPTVRDPYQGEIWDLTLPDALQLAMTNCTILRSRGTFKSPANPLLASPDRVSSRFDPAMQESNTGPVQRGLESALSMFDAQFTTDMTWGHDENVQNNRFLGGGLTPGKTLISDSGQFQQTLSKVLANGGTTTFTNNWSSLYTNQPFQLFPSYYRGYVRADYRQPLLQGAGTEFTRIAGPMARQIPGLPILDGGVTIARINTDISIADFELAVVNMVRDVEDMYWELYLAYRTYDAELAATNASSIFWKNTKERMDVGAKRGSPLDEAQARENYFTSRMRLENAVGSLYSNEGQLRRMLGLPVRDGRIIRPIDEPLSAEFSTDWRMALSESLVRRVELRRQKWQIKSLELQLYAAEQLVKPRLDFVGGYQVNGFGDQLISQQSADGRTARGYNSAITALTRGTQSSWDAGFEFSLPVGMRQALATKRFAELRLSKARAVLAMQELEISHELGNAVQLIDWWYQIAQTSFDRKAAAGKQLEATVKEYNSGSIPIDLVVRTEANLAAAEVGYFNALVKYNQAINDLRMRRGTLLEENAIHLSESDWTPEAYGEAVRRAWARSFGIEAPKKRTEPPEFVAGGAGYVEQGAPYPSSLPIPPEMGGGLPYQTPPAPASSVVPVILEPVPNGAPPASETVQ